MFGKKASGIALSAFFFGYMEGWGVEGSILAFVLFFITLNKEHSCKKIHFFFFALLEWAVTCCIT